MSDRQIVGSILAIVAALAFASCHPGTTADGPASTELATTKLVRTENVNIQILASAQTTGELKPCG